MSEDNIVTVCPECRYPFPDNIKDQLAPFHSRGDGEKCLGVGKELVEVEAITVKARPNFRVSLFPEFCREA